MSELWASAAAYERFMGRWSRLVARECVTWLDVEARARWLDVGCGTGALAETVLDTAAPEQVTGADPSEPFVGAARERLAGRPAEFVVADAQALPFDDGSFDAAVAGLVLNFVPHPAAGLAEMARVTRPGGVVAGYVWDYAEGMEFLRSFWDAALVVDERAQAEDEGRRFPLCRPEPLEALFRDAGLSDVEVRPIDVPTRFTSFDDLWTPFLGGKAPAPAFVMSLGPEQREALRERLHASLPVAADGSIPLTARAWAARGRR
jgi:SAM-dependent methyltransferase